MKQPDIKSFGEWSADDHSHKIANHWNIAKHHIENLQGIINRLYLDDRVKLPYDVQRRIENELDNARVGIHNLGQELVEIEQLGYDYDNAEKDSWAKDFGIYEPRTKVSTLTTIK